MDADKLRRFYVTTFTIGIAALTGCASQPTSTHGRNANAAANGAPQLSPEAINASTTIATKQVIAAEQAFAKTMADRDFKTFVTFLSPDAVFFGGSNVARGSAAVASNWETYFAGREAPFSWTPDHVEVLASGTLALSTGPVFQNHKIVGRFNSIWRLESANTWRIVFDKGEAVCGINP